MKYVFLLLTAVSLLTLSCEKDYSPISPVENNYTSHEYEWAVDTLSAPDAFQILMSGIWGTDENNVWVVGHSDWTKYQIWHWNGNNWENVYASFPGHPYSLAKIHGFAADDVWAVGDEFHEKPGGGFTFQSFIIHYNGSRWELVQDVTAPQALSVWGTSSSDLFVGCDSGIVLHHNGSDWTLQNTGTISRIYSIAGFNSQEVYAAGYHLDKQQPIDTTFYYFFEYNGSEWNVVDSFLDYPFAPPKPFEHRLWASPDGNLYAAGTAGLYQWNHGSWAKIRDERLSGIYGTAWNNIFTGGPWNNLFHFNGDTWHRYNFFNNYSFDAGFSFWCNRNFVFMSAQLGNQSFIIRGKLKE